MAPHPVLHPAPHRAAGGPRVVRRGSGRTTAAILVLLAAAPAWARQPAPTADEPPQNQPSTDPQLHGESVENTLEAMRKRDGSIAAPVQPSPVRTPVAAAPAAGQARTAGTDTVAAAPGVRRWREGVFLTRRSGTLIKARTGDWIFVPRPTAEGSFDPPLVLLPSQNLERLENAIGAGVDRPAVSISGQVFAYRGHDYLLTSEASSPLVEEPETPAAPAAPDKPAVPDPAAQAEDLVRDLETRRTRPRALPRATPAAATEGSARTVQTSGPTEGTLITARRGRIVRLPDGDLAFTTDNDGPSPDRALPLAPCATLSRMESVSLWRGDGVALEVSGRILTYRGKRYLLPTMFVVPGVTDVSPLQ